MQKISFESPSLRQAIDLSALPKGAYFLQIVGEEKTAMRRILQQ